MTDPSNALSSFQEEHLHGRIPLQPGAIYSDLYVYADMPEGKVRLTYVKLENDTVTAFVSFVQHTPVEGTPCFQIGYAVPETYRNQGRAKEIIGMALSEMRYGYRHTILSTFYVEAIVGADNDPSKRVAKQVLSATPVAMIDQVSGLPAFQYLRKIG